MTTESTGTSAKQIASGYAVEGRALELGAVVVDVVCDPSAQVRIPLATVNRHGLVAGATGTGKTKSLRLIAEQLSAAGVPCLMADVKGDQQGLPLLDLKDLRSVIQYLTSDEGKRLLKSLGAVSSTTAGVILRALVNLEAEGGDTFFGEPELEPKDLLSVDDQGRGVITLLELGSQATRPVIGEAVAIAAAAKTSPLQDEYGQTVDRDSAYERLAAKLAPPPDVADVAPVELPAPPPMPAPAEDPGFLEKMMASPAFKSAMRSAGTVIGREITRSIFGTGRRRRR